MIAIQNLSKSFGAVEAVKDVALEVARGEMFGLIGPDGAGKTTLIRILCTLLKPDAGACTINHFNTVADFMAIRAIVGYMPQRFSLYQDLTVAENLRFFADLFQVSPAEREQRLTQLLQFSKLEPFQKRRAGRLSGGMKQKLALSCTLIHTPEILFLDEPTTGVDPVSRREFWDILASLKKQGVTLFITTPYMDEALKCDRVAFMHKGRILTSDVPSRLPGLFKNKLLEVRSKNILQSVKWLNRATSIKSIQTFGDKLHITTSNPFQTEAEIRSILDENHFEEVRIDLIPPSLEDVFIQLMT
ncbi:ABC transporter ATP-binding protein [candidate division KSB1 bacterium]|nr:ABC transporter ATP-binding protein [candidate division KSB1 bacterium]